jgi:prevent-host-death family protein
MSAKRKGVEAARRELPALLAEAEKGRPTIVTRHGRDVAAIMPLRHAGLRLHQQQSLLPLAGSCKGLWGRNSRNALRRLRDEWER